MKTKNQENPYRKAIEITEIIENHSFSLLRFLGYTLLIFSLIDYLGILIPPRLTDPNWEFQAIGQMVDHVWSILMGLIFIFLYNQGSIIKPRQLSILKFFSWAALPIGIVYLLMLPLGINDSLTLYKNINNQFTHQQAQQQEQLQKVTEKLNSTNSSQELNNIARALNLPNASEASQSPQELKNKISQQIQTSSQSASTAANIAKREQVKNLIKTALRINLGAIISGVCLITLWRLTRWTRIIEKNVG